MAVARDQNLHFTTDIRAAIAAAELIFVSIGTPTRNIAADHAADLRDIESAITLVAERPKIIVEKASSS